MRRATLDMRTCKKCGEDFQVRTIEDDGLSRFNRRTHCFDCRPSKDPRVHARQVQEVWDMMTNGVLDPYLPETPWEYGDGSEESALRSAGF